MARRSSTRPKLRIATSLNVHPNSRTPAMLLLAVSPTMRRFSHRCQPFHVIAILHLRRARLFLQSKPQRAPGLKTARGELSGMDADGSLDAPQSRRKRPIVAIIASILWALGLVPACGLAITSVFLFDNPKPAGNPAIAATAAVLMPVLCVAAIAGVWIVWACSSARRPLLTLQVLLSCLPLLSIAALAIYFTITGGAI